MTTPNKAPYQQREGPGQTDLGPSLRLFAELPRALILGATLFLTFDPLRQAGLYLFRNFRLLLCVGLYPKFLIFRHQVRTLLVFRDVVRQYCWFVLGEGYP